MTKSISRFDYFDNIKALLIFLVVLGHLMEPFLGNASVKFVYILIYSFHMPLFVFVSGYFVNTSAKKILTRLVYPYIVFQLLYLVFIRYILGLSETVLTFTTPFWVLWYLLASIFWTISVKLIKKVNLMIVLIALAAGLLAGFYNPIGLYLSLSRTIVFAPFFLLGTYCRQNEFDFRRLKVSRFFISIILFLLVISVAYIFINLETINVAWLYSFVGYRQISYDFLTRAATYLTAFAFSAFVMIVMPDLRIHLFSNVGVNNMPVFLLHGFIVRFLWVVVPVSLIATDIKTWAYLLVAATTIVLILSSKIITKAFSIIFPK